MYNKYGGNVQKIIKSFDKNSTSIATLKGYDVVYVKSENTYVLLNRGKLLVEE